MGCNDRQGRKGKHECKIRRANMLDTMLAFYPLRTNDEELVMEAGNVRVWIEWPPFNVHIRKF